VIFQHDVTGNFCDRHGRCLRVPTQKFRKDQASMTKSNKFVSTLDLLPCRRIINRNRFLECNRPAVQCESFTITRPVEFWDVGGSILLAVPLGCAGKVQTDCISVASAPGNLHLSLTEQCQSDHSKPRMIVRGLRAASPFEIVTNS